MRIAIVGQGPKGIYSLCELLTTWPTAHPLEVHTFDPRPVGHGSAYSVEQPPHMRLNVRPPVLHLPPLPPFQDWLRLEGLDPDSEELPRSAVGRYLSRARHAMVDQLPPTIQVHHHATGVQQVRTTHDGWLVHGEDEEEVLVDELLLTTGHAPRHDHQLEATWDPHQKTRLVPTVYPVEQRLDEEHVPPGCTVAIRGAALTFIDVALHLVEGRQPDRRPARILPISRSGTLMHSRPLPGHELYPDDRALLERHAAQMPCEPQAIIETVVQAAIDQLVNSRYTPEEAERMVRHTLATGWEIDLEHVPQRALAALNRSIAVAEATERAGAAWALGRAWGTLYPEVVRQLSFLDHAPERWTAFNEQVRILNCFAFGPGPGNAIRIADLCERQVIDLSWLAIGIQVTDRIVGLPDGEEQPDVLIDAVPSPPGAATARTPLLDDLLEVGLVSLPPGRRGLRVTRDAQALGSDGNPTPGLSVIGRPVDDTVLGNDTLNQAAHEQIPQWAARMAALQLHPA